MFYQKQHHGSVLSKGENIEHSVSIEKLLYFPYIPQCSKSVCIVTFFYIALPLSFLVYKKANQYIYDALKKMHMWGFGVGRRSGREIPIRQSGSRNNFCFSLFQYNKLYSKVYFFEIVPIFTVCQPNIDILLPIPLYFNSIPVDET